MKAKLIFIFFFTIYQINSKTLVDQHKKGGKQLHKVFIKVAYTPDMQYVFKKLKDLFEKSHNLTEILGSKKSSGFSVNNLNKNKVFHILLSANKYNCNLLRRKRKTRGKIKRFIKGELVLYAPNSKLLLDYNYLNYRKTPSALVLKNILLSPKIKRLVIANPKVSPYGQAAFKLLNKLNVMQFLKKKILLVKSISQVNLYLRNQIASLGFTDRSYAYARRIKGGYRSEKEDRYYVRTNKIWYGNLDHYMVKTVYGNTEQKKVANDFYKFMQGNQARSLLKSYGFSIR